MPNQIEHYLLTDKEIALAKFPILRKGFGVKYEDYVQLHDYIILKAQDLKTRSETLREVGEIMDKESFDTKDKMPTWFIELLAKLKNGSMPD